MVRLCVTLFVCFALASLAPCAPLQKAKAGTALGFSWDLRESVNGDAPKGKLYLNIAGKRVPVATLHTNPSKMDRSEYAQMRVPKTALGAVKSWWAGGGDLFYVIRSGTRIKVMKSWYGEELDKPEPWKTLAVFSSNGTRLKR